jgi:hypothetical protein
MNKAVTHSQFKGCHGWEMDSKFFRTGWRIETMMRHDGISSIATQCQYTPNGGYIHFPTEHKSITLGTADPKQKATAKAIRNIHHAALMELFRLHPEAFRRSVRVNFSDGNKIETEINGTAQTIRAYYLGQRFTLDEKKPQVEAISVDFLDMGE